MYIYMLRHLSETDSLEAEAWEAHKELRRAIVKKNALLSRPSPQRVGNMSLEALSMNAPMLKVLLQIWVPTLASPKTTPIDQLKREAWHHQ